jgi:hypothetical protein
MDQVMDDVLAQSGVSGPFATLERGKTGLRLAGVELAVPEEQVH